MFRTPIPNAELSTLENLGTAQLLGFFESCLKTGSRVGDYGRLSDAWGTLFSGLYLSGEELIEEMQRGEHRLGAKDERMLREFVSADCRNGGLFVLNVIKKGGTIDRAALIMIADLGDLAGIEHNGTTAIHLLADACDKGLRPALIRKAGNRLLSCVYDRRGIPVIFTIFALGDLCLYDLEAITKVFSEDELKKIMCRTRTGKNALTVFTEIALSLKSHAPLDRHMFFKSTAVKDTDTDRKTGMQIKSQPLSRTSPPTQAAGCKKADNNKEMKADVPDSPESMSPDDTTDNSRI
jgi:hypothetical protein